MIVETLDAPASSTARTGSGYAEWASRTSGSDPSQFAQLSNFDLAVNDELRRVADLKPNWDSEEARPVGIEIITAAREFVSGLPNDLKETVGIPAVVPMTRGPEQSGNLQFEWGDGVRSLELEIENPTTVHFLQWHAGEGVEREDFFSIGDIEAAVTLIRWFAGS
jgi:hypothetical protein